MSAPSDPPPPTYVPSQPQILITPLPDSASFFWGRTVQGEIYVKGLGEGTNRTGLVKSLSVLLQLTNHLPNHPTISLGDFPAQVLYPSAPTLSDTSSSTPSDSSSSASPFPTAHRFSIPLPSSLDPSSRDTPLPGTLNLTPYEKGEVRWSLQVKLVLPSGQVEECIKIEGTPQEVCSTSSPTLDEYEAEGTGPQEVEEVLEQGGALARLVLDRDSPRLGDLLRLGVEIKPQERKKTGVAGLSSQPDPAETLRPLRRVRVELYRKVVVRSNDRQTPSNQASSSSSTSSTRSGGVVEHLSLLHASGKSLRYPGSGRAHPPLRVLFTIPTAQQGLVAEQIWGEITSSTPYHATSFFVRVTVGFGEPSISVGDSWVLQREINIRPKKWAEPREVVVERGLEPALGTGLDSSAAPCPSAEEVGIHPGEQGLWTLEDMRREAYRQKGRDVVGDGGTIRLSGVGGEEDLPPPFEGHTTFPEGGEGSAGPSTSTSTSGSGLPTFLESEAQARTGEMPVFAGEQVRSERLVPRAFDDDANVGHDHESSQVLAGVDGDEPGLGEEGFDRTNWVGRRGSLGGELGTWVEYDGYETFSVAPPSLDASYGVGGSMDPPQEWDEAGQNLVPGMVARLGLGMDGDAVGRRGTGLELMEQLGLGEGTRVVDLQDDLPPGIDEPSLPALPDFHAHPSPRALAHGPPPPPLAHAPAPYSPPLSASPAHDPPSFDASQAASAVGGVAASRLRSTSTGALPAVASAGAGARRPSRHVEEPLPLPLPVAGPHGGEVHVHVHAEGEGEGEAPPGYERAGETGLPPYS